MGADWHRIRQKTFPTFLENTHMDFDFDIDAVDLGMALGLGEEIAEAEIEQQIAQQDFESTATSKETSEGLTERQRGNAQERVAGEWPKKKGSKTKRDSDIYKSPYYNPFLHYAAEVAEGTRKLGDTTGIYFGVLEDGPDENGVYPWQK